MGLFANLWRSAPQMSPEHLDRVQRLEELPPPTRNRHRASRYVTVDVETTGLDMRRDRVLSIGAISVVGGGIDLAHCFEVTLKQPESSPPDNILVHRIGGQRQLTGLDPTEALIRFLEYVRRAPLVAYRSEFDRTMLDRALNNVLGVSTQSAWIDLAKLLPALYPPNENRTMDDWLRFMGIHILARHDALADALATAQMLQICLHQADRLNMTCPQHLIEMQKAQHWLGKR